MARPRHLTVIASLSIAQGFIAILVALLFFGIASIFDQSRSVTSSLMVMIAQARGGVLIIIALMYLAFVVGAWHARDRAGWIGLFASVLNILYLMHVLLRGESVVIVLLGWIIPLTIYMDMFIRFAKVRPSYATKLYSTWRVGSFLLASPAGPLKLNGYPSSPLIRNQRIS